MSRKEVLNLSKKLNTNKRLLIVINNLLKIFNDDNKISLLLESKKERLEYLINSELHLLTNESMNNCNHLFTFIKKDKDRKVICLKCGLTNMYEDVGIYGTSKEAEMNRTFLSQIKDIEQINICLELGVFANPYYAKNLYLRAIKDANTLDTEVIKKMIELRKIDQGKSKVLK